MLKVALVILTCCDVFAQSPVSSWFPSRVGDKWIYQYESREGSVKHSGIMRFESEESVVSSEKIPEGAFITKRVTPLDPKPAWAIKKGDIHYLIRQECVYVLDGIDASGDRQALDHNNKLLPEYRAELLRGDVPPDFCFPLKTGRGKTVHVSVFEGGGVTHDIWFEKGRGVVRERWFHNGTYNEDLSRLVRFEPAPL